MKFTNKRTLLILLFCLCLSPFVLGQTAVEKRTPSSDSAEVVLAINTFLDAFTNLKWAEFKACFAETATSFFPSPRYQAQRANNRAEIETLFRPMFDTIPRSDRKPPYLNIQPKDTHIQMAGDLAIVTFHLAGKGSLGRRTLVLQKQRQKWLILHLHASVIELPEK